MANSPTNEAFALYNLTTGALLSGQAGSMSFLVYHDTAGTALTNPSITEIGATGFYQFTPIFSTNASRGLIYVINTGTNANPSRVSRYVRPEDWTTDQIPVIRKFVGNGWAVINSGGDSNRLVVYDDDGVTPVYKFDLKDSLGVATSTNPATRTRVGGF